MSRHQEQTLKTAGDESEGRDKIIMSRHHKRATDVMKEVDVMTSRNTSPRIQYHELMSRQDLEVVTSYAIT